MRRRRWYIFARVASWRFTQTAKRDSSSFAVMNWEQRIGVSVIASSREMATATDNVMPN